MNSLELLDRKEQINIKLKKLIDTAKSEVRKLSDNEDTEFKKLLTERSGVEDELRNIDNQLNNKTKQIKTMKNFSLLRAIEARANGKALSEEALRVIEAGNAEMRKSGVNYSGEIVLPTEFRADIVAGTATAGQEVIAEEKFGILEPLRNHLVLVQAGANYLSGLVGDVSIPTYSGTSAL